MELTGTITDTVTGALYNVSLSTNSILVNVRYLELIAGLIIGAIVGAVFWVILK